MSSISSESPGSPGVPASMVHPDSMVIVNQGTWLPEEVVASILPEIPTLTMAMNPIEWCNTTRRALHQVELLCFLLDIKVIHPKPEDPDYKNWYEWSTTAYRWMYSNMEKDVQNIIDNMSDRSKTPCADWLYNAVFNMEHSHDAMNSANQWQKWRSLRRDNYPSAAAYIAAYRTQFDIVRQLKQGPSCFIALWSLVQELENELPEARSAVGYLALHRQPEKVDHETFVAHCDHMITKSNNPDLGFSGNSPGKEGDTPCPRGSSSKRQRC